MATDSVWRMLHYNYICTVLYIHIPLSIGKATPILYSCFCNTMKIYFGLGCKNKHETIEQNFNFHFNNVKHGIVCFNPSILSDQKYWNRRLTGIFCYSIVSC